jgi:hypothetical protein
LKKLKEQKRMLMLKECSLTEDIFPLFCN